MAYQTHDYGVMRYCVVSYLLHIRSLVDSIDDAETRLARACARLDLMGVDYCGKDMPVGAGADHGDDAVAEGVALMQELREELAAEVAHGHDDIKEARSLCRTRYPARHALWLHYVDRMTWQEVGERMRYQASYVRQELARAGIFELYSLMPEQWRNQPIPNSDSAFR